MKTISCATWTSPLGPMLIAASGDGLIGAWFEGQRHFTGCDAAWTADDGRPLLRDAQRQLQAYFDGRLDRKSVV